MMSAWVVVNAVVVFYSWSDCGCGDYICDIVLCLLKKKKNTIYWRCMDTVADLKA